MDSSFEPLSAAAARLETEPTRTRFPADHFAQFYIQHETLIDSVATYVVEGIEKGAGAIVIATQTHQTALQARWTSSHFDFDDASDRGQLLLLDAAETLAEFMVQGAPDSDRFHRSVGQIVARVSEQYPRVVAFGEMVSVLWAQGNAAAAVTLEELWNELSRRYPLTLFCGYALSDCIDEKADQAFEQVCCAHSHVILAESYHPASNQEHRRQIAQLQRKALALELRLARDNELRHSLAQLAAIVESSDDAIVAVTLDGTIQSW
ncbi:MAG TPA: MEDS domain-containing protein, partial [Steroidobacteraceae bacterium]